MKRITTLQRRHQQLGEEALHAHRNDAKVVRDCLKQQRAIAAELHTLGALTIDEIEDAAINMAIDEAYAALFGPTPETTAGVHCISPAFAVR